MPALVPALALAIGVGLTVGMLGGGGSILTLPILKYLLGQSAHAAIAGSLFVVGVTSLGALLPHARAGRVAWRVGLTFGAASMLGAYLGGSVAHVFPAGALLVVFALLMIVTAGAMLRRTRPRVATAGHPRALAVLAQGVVLGAVTGLIGAGGGFLVVPALVVLGGLPMPVAVGTSLVVLALNAFSGFAGHVSSVAIDWTVLAPLAATALLGASVGARAVARIEPTRLRRVFGWFVVVMGVFILSQELPPLFGVRWPITVPLALAALTVLFAVALERRVPKRDEPGDPRYHASS